MINRQKLIEAVEKEYYKFIDDDTEVAHNRAIYDVIEIIKDQPPADKCVPLSEVYRVIAGHSDYHGDNILAALTCIAEGKEVKPVRPLPADVPDTNVGEWIDTGVELKLIHTVGAIKPPRHFEIIKDGEIVKEFILCNNPEGEPGYYETVEGKFYGVIPGPYKGVE